MWVMNVASSQAWKQAQGLTIEDARDLEAREALYLWARLPSNLQWASLCLTTGRPPAAPLFVIMSIKHKSRAPTHPVPLS